MDVSVVVNFLSQVMFVFLLFLGMVMYANEVETKGKLKLPERKINYNISTEDEPTCTLSQWCGSQFAVVRLQLSLFLLLLLIFIPVPFFKKIFCLKKFGTIILYLSSLEISIFHSI